MRVTVAVCTRNRAQILEGALRSLREVRIPDEVEWEVLVVDNGSEDTTREVAASFGAAVPLRLVREGRAGLSHARNRAVREADGDYLLWMDDDVLLTPEWLAEYAKAFRRWPGSAFFGGPIYPRLEGDPPDWLARTLPVVRHTYAARDLGEESVLLGPGSDRLPFGANYAVRMEDQRLHPYPVDLGRRPDALMGGEEIAVFRAIMAAGGDGWWVPGAAAYHRIGPERQTTGYLRRYSYWDALHEELSPRARRTPSPWRPLQLLWRATAEEMIYQLHRRSSAPETWVPRLLAAGGRWGQLRGSLLRTKTERAP